jgi:hypothetical protein
MPKGLYRIFLPNGHSYEVPNKIVDEGNEAFAKMCLHADNTIVAGAANFYVGLTAGTPDDDTLLSTLTGEPPVADGYSRKAIVRSSAGWTLSKINGNWRAISPVLTWTPSGTWASGFDRAFLCSVSAGSSGVLFGYSAAFPELITPSVGNPVEMQYELWWV